MFNMGEFFKRHNNNNLHFLFDLYPKSLEEQRYSFFQEIVNDILYYFT